MTKGQLDRLANICEDLGKGNIVAALAGPVITDTFGIIQTTTGILAGLTMLYMAIKIEGSKET